MKKIAIIGQGFVGLAVRNGMSHAFEVFSYDKVHGCVDSKNQTHLKLDETSAYLWLLQNTDGPIFVCVPTPMNKDGCCDTSIVESVVQSLSEGLNEVTRVVVIKSTVPPGTTESINNKYDNLNVCYNPEFLRETSAQEDFDSQSRIIIGGPRDGTNVLKQMYERAYPDVPVTKTSSTIAELVKYTTNVFLAVKVSVANEIKQLCDKLNVDYDKVVEYATKDTRLGTSHWSVPGPDGKKGFGGSCFPKDLNALICLAEELGVSPNVMYGAWQTNLEVRSDRDWENLVGRAVNYER